ncbi:InlB B-repeat-containing protein, partial [Paenibacillus ferrarius]|uniref:InlB B-repeat-containing protein n=1 Tax=Paenibacillus ferrarius TaxID=1469647 RepID=UPI003D2CC8C6
NVTADKSLTANFAINEYTLTYTAGANGTLSDTTPQTVEHGSNGTAVTAIPDTHYHFVKWSDNVTTATRT